MNDSLNPDDSGKNNQSNEGAANERAKETLRASEAQFQMLFNDAPLGIYLVDADFRIRAVNPVALPVFGDAPDLIGRDFDEAIHRLWSKEYADEIVALFRHTLETGAPYFTPERIEERRDRSVIEYYEWQINRISLSDDSYGVVCYFRDISERVLTKETLRESEKKYRTLFNSIDEGFVVNELLYDEAGKPFDALVLETNPSFDRMMRVENAIGKRALEIFPDAETSWFEAYASVVETGESLRFENYLAPLDSWFELYVSLVGDGASRRFAIVFNDITERKLAEEALRESEERLRTLVENLPGGAVFVVDKNLRYLVAQGEALTAAGFAPEDLIGCTINETMPPELVAEYEALYRQTLAGESFSHEHSAHNRSFISRGVPLRAATGEIYAVIVVSYDITERKRAEELLRESEERLRLLVESASDYAIFTLTLDGRINSWNAGAEKVFGWTESEILGESAAIVFTPEDRAAGEPEKEIATALRTGRAPDERFHVRKDGSRFYASGVLTALKEVGGRVQGFAKIARDMTERIEAERVVRGKEMLQKVIGAQEDERRRIARDLHDHLGQQITALRLKLEILKQTCDGDEKTHRQVDDAQAIAEQIDSDIDFLAWEMRPSALDDIGLLPALERYIGEWSRQFHIAADFRAGKFGKNRLAADAETQLYRIAQECLNNVAKHARASNVDVSLERRADFAVLIIEDDGIGFAADELISSKMGAKHLGLVGMRERAALVQGTIEIESAHGAGTTVFVRVPVSDFKSSAKRKKKKDE